MKVFLATLREFLLLWLLYFIFIAIVALVGLYLMGPVVVFVKGGEFKVPWSIEPLLTVGRGVVAGSFALAVVMFLWEHLKQKRVGDKS
jgi:hypothetical protein